jgi:hypothetical protein
VKTNWSKFIQAFPEHEDIEPTDEELSNNMFLNFIISNVIQLTLSQIEETFCDGVGMAIFGQSYALAFHYLLAPSLGGNRSLEYPKMEDRTNFIATLGGIDLTKHGFVDFKTEFLDKPIKMASTMYDEARQIVQSKARPFAADAQAQSGIINAGWAFFQSQAPSFDEKERELVEWVSELVLKSIEVLEFRSKVTNA